MNDLTGSSFWNKKWSRGYKWRRFLLSNREAIKVLKNTLQYVPLKGTFLEIGIAPGRFVEKYFSIRNDLRYDGIDISHIGISEVEKLYRKKDINGDLYLKDFRKCKFLYDKYDVVCSHGLIEHFNDFESVIGYHVRFLKSGGIAFISVPNYNHCIVRFFLENFSKVSFSTHNFECLDLGVMIKSAEKFNITVLESGVFGGSILPSSNVDKGLKGILYKKFAQAWNLFVSGIAVVSNNKIIIKFWDSNIYIVCRKK